MPVSHDDDTSTLAELKFQNGEHFVAENTTDKGCVIITFDLIIILFIKFLPFVFRSQKMLTM